MSANTSIKVQSEFAELVRNAASRSHRSLAGQLEYWARIGIAVERLPATRKRIDDAVNGTLDAATLTEEDLAFFEEAMAFANPTAEDDAAFAAYLRSHGGGVGVDDAGRIVKRSAQGMTTVLAESVGDDR